MTGVQTLIVSYFPQNHVVDCRLPFRKSKFEVTRSNTIRIIWSIFTYARIKIHQRSLKKKTPLLDISEFNRISALNNTRLMYQICKEISTNLIYSFKNFQYLNLHHNNKTTRQLKCPIYTFYSAQC